MVFAVLTPNAVAVDTIYISEPITPRYSIECTPTSKLTILSNKATCQSSFRSEEIKSVTAEQTLEKFWGLWVWNEVEDACWAKTVNASNFTMSNSKSGLDSGTYRLKTEFTVTANNGTTETITVYSDEVTI